MERDLLFHKKVCTLPLELFVRLLLGNYDHVTRLSSRVLVSFAMEGVLVVVWCSFINVRLQNLLFFHDLLSIACLALVLFVD